MMRHISDENLARYLEGDLRPRRAAKVGSHLAGCSGCQARAAALKGVPNLLASVQYPPIPARLSSQIERALAAESSARVASTPASEAGRLDLPARARPARQAWRMPWLNSQAGLRTVAAVGAAVIVAGGGYALVSHAGPSASPAGTSISGPPAAPAKVQNGPSVHYRHAGHTDSIKTVKSGTNYVSATLAGQAERVLAVQRKSTSVPSGGNAAGSYSTFAAPNSRPGQASSPSASAAATARAARLQGCVDRIAAGRSVLLVDAAKYEGSAATIIMVSSGASGRAEVYAVGPGCSASASNILAQQSLSRL
jgi:hypothetical protein